MNHATASGTAQRAAQAVNGLTYRAGWDSLTLSAFGLGAGRARLAPAALPAVIQHYLAHGGNLLDAQSQPAAMGAGLAQARAAGALRREHIIVCAEGGPGEADGPDLSPAEVRRQVRAALQALGLARLDLFWLTGADALSAQAGEAELRFHLREAFAALEVAVAQDEISAYGLALADLAFPPALALEIAYDVIGARHHLRALRLPAEAWSPGQAPDLAGLTLLATTSRLQPPPPPAPAAAVIVEAGAWPAVAH
mgnify:CR=1 FL=1